jgi:hypothetical protein
MPKSLNELRPVFTAIREAPSDAHIEWPAIESAFFGTALLGLTPGRPLPRHLGAIGAPAVQIENASASKTGILLQNDNPAGKASREESHNLPLA